jgi:hypothetical protein
MVRAQFGGFEFPQQHSGSWENEKKRNQCGNAYRALLHIFPSTWI